MKFQKVSLEHIASIAGVHKATVSRALRNHSTIPLPTRERIQEIARREGYRPNPLVALYQAQARSNRPSSMQATLTWMNDYPNAECWHVFPWLRGYLKGAKERCESRGYRLDELTLPHNEPISCADEVNKMMKLIRARGIFGVVLPLMFRYGYLLEPWDGVAVSLIGSGHFGLPSIAHNGHTINPSARFYPRGFSVADRDLYFNTRLALQSLQRAGYERVGFVYSRYLDTEAFGRAASGYFVEQSHLSEDRRLPILFIERFKEGRPANFDQWMEQHKPDAILCVNPAVKEWVEQLGFSVPQDIGLANLNLVEDVSNWSGIDENHAQIGGSAIDLIIDQLSRNELSAPRQTRQLLVPGRWVQGATTRQPEIPPSENHAILEELRR